MSFELDYHDFRRVERIIANLPQEIRNKAISRTMRRMSSTGKTRIVGETAKISKLPKWAVNAATSASFNGIDTQKFVVRSDWIPLSKLGAVASPTGVFVHLRGSYRHAFLAGMKSGHSGVMRRVGNSRYPIREQFAANPANVVTNKPDDYLSILTDILGTQYLPRLIHEIDNLLSGR